MQNNALLHDFTRATTGTCPSPSTAEQVYNTKEKGGLSQES